VSSTPPGTLEKSQGDSNTGAVGRLPDMAGHLGFMLLHIKEPKKEKG
jgi:hypothetical protein